ncbi:MAG: SigB/SigF/SigG family RNA polymerase sigma factor [Bacillota bacterium]|nr:SigB/SigF/SigG family RNA polymerase sigma factor [Bacillota bacterium]
MGDHAAAPALLSEARTQQLLAAAQNGDFYAKEQLIEANMRLVGSIVRRFRRDNDNAEDLFQVGCIGLLKAIDKFDFSYGVCFSTYAVPLVMGEIRRYLRDDALITVGRGLKERAAAVQRMRRELAARQGMEPTTAQVAQALQLSEEQVAQALDIYRPPLSLSQPLDGGDGTLTVGERLGGDGSFDSERIIESLSLRRLLAELPERLRLIIGRRYFQQRTQAEVARELGVSQVQVSRLEKQALQKIRARLEEE